MEKPKIGSTTHSFAKGVMRSRTVISWEGDTALMSDGSKIKWNPISGWETKPFDSANRSMRE